MRDPHPITDPAPDEETAGGVDAAAIPSRANWRRWLLPLVGAVVCLVLGLASGGVSPGDDEGWYQSLAKPVGQPPGWAFGVVWTVLYLMMGMALGRLIARRAWSAVGWFALQLLLNLSWSPIFFGSRQMLLALGVIVALWVTLTLTMRNARRVDAAAFWLLLPYLLWVSYAVYLNGAIVWLNR